jgi:DNA polymerase-3 subunit epsilon
MTETTGKFEMYCIVELFGHQKIAGKVSEQSIGGGGFIRVDVPKTSKREAWTKLYGPNAIYAITPVTAEICSLMAERFEVEPISEWQLSQALQKKLLAAGAVDDDDTWDEDFDRPFEGDMPDSLIVEADSSRIESEARRLHKIVKVECYKSGSGNVTWKAWDEEAYLIYLRQAYRDMLTEADLWDTLNQMSIGDSWAAEFTLSTVQDGDFLKPVEIRPGGKVMAPEADGSSAILDIDTKALSAEWARDLLQKEFVIFDLETTGFEDDDEIVQVAVIDQDGKPLLDTLVHPSKPIPNSDYHGITDDMVSDAPDFLAAYDQIKAALDGKVVIAFNYEYDSRMLQQDCERYGLEPILLPVLNLLAHCAMKQFARYNGQWNAKYNDYKFKGLEDALFHFELTHEDFGPKAHDACTDAKAALAVIQKMAEYGQSDEA